MQTIKCTCCSFQPLVFHAWSEIAPVAFGQPSWLTRPLMTDEMAGGTMILWKSF